MPNRMVAGEFFTLGTLSSGSTNGAATSLGVPFSRFSVYGVQSVSTGTFTVILQGATSSGFTTGATLATIDASTSLAWNTTAIPCLWIRARATAGPSSGGNEVTVTAACSW